MTFLYILTDSDLRNVFCVFLEGRVLSYRKNVDFSTEKKVLAVGRHFMSSIPNTQAMNARAITPAHGLWPYTEVSNSNRYTHTTEDIMDINGYTLMETRCLINPVMNEGENWTPDVAVLYCSSGRNVKLIGVYT